MITLEQGKKLEAERSSDGGLIARIGGIAIVTLKLALLLMLVPALVLILGLAWIRARND